MLSLGQSTSVWCIGAFLGWIAIPLMSTNLEAIFCLTIPADIQGRVFAARNTFQFFTIPVGYFLGGLLVDYLFEPFMAAHEAFCQVLFGVIDAQSRRKRESAKRKGSALCVFSLRVRAAASS